MQHIEASEQESGDMVIIVRSDEILDVTRVLRWIDEERPDIRQSHDCRRPILEPQLVRSTDREEIGCRFVDLWTFEKVTA